MLKLSVIVYQIIIISTYFFPEKSFLPIFGIKAFAA